MINLLPPEHVNMIRYARQNTTLRKWLLGSLAAIAGLVIIMMAGWIYMDRQAKGLQKNIMLTNQQLKAQNLSKVEADAKEISGDIRVINQVLSNEIRFSGLIQSIGSVMPQGAVLGSLSLNKITGALDLSANTTNYASAAQIAANLSDPANGIFSKVDVITVNCTPNQQPYFCNATYKALFSKSTKNKFLNVPKGSD